jgi:hypothetical protein
MGMKVAQKSLVLISTVFLFWQACSFSNGKLTNRSFLQRLSGMEYRIDEYVVKLENGAYEQETLPDSASKLHVDLSDWLTFGDLNNDARSDAAAILTTNMGGSGINYYLVPVVQQADNPVALKAIRLGDRISMVSLSIENQQIAVVYLEQNTGDSTTSAANREMQRRFAIIDNTVSELSEFTISLNEYVRALRIK